MKHHPRKTAITLTPPTVGRQSADLSADRMPDFSSFFIGRQKINYNYLLIITTFFSIGRKFWGFGNRPMIVRWSADDRPMIGRCHIRMSHISSADVSADRRPIIGRRSADRRSPFIIGRCVGRRSADCKILVLI